MEKIELPVVPPSYVKEGWDGAFRVFPWIHFVINHPRPLYMITTLKENGLSNVQLSAWGLLLGSGIEPKFLLQVMKSSDTYRLIVKHKEFVVNIPSLDLKDKFMKTTTHFPDDVDEVSSSGLTAVPSKMVNPPRVAECWGHYECRLDWVQDVEKDVKVNALIQGSVVHAAIDERCLRPTVTEGMSERSPAYRFTEYYFHNRKEIAGDGGTVTLDLKRF